MGKNFIRWRVKGVRIWVSVCLDCCQFVCAEPDPAKVDETEATHRCGRAERSRKVSPAAVTESGVKPRASQSVSY